MNSLAIQTQNLSVEYHTHKALDNISLAIPTGSVVGLLGRNGAGKSTLIKALLGFLKPTHGTCSLLGQPSWDLSDDLKTRLGIVLQSPTFYAWLTGAELIDYTSDFYPRWDAALAQRLVTQWDLPLARKVSEYSGGEVQKLACILALCHHSDIFILDEPASALDPVSRRQLLSELIDIAGGEGKTILFSTHIVSDLERIADRIMILNRGSLTLDMPLDTLKESVKRLRLFRHDGAPFRVTDPALLKPRHEPGCVLGFTTGYSPDLIQRLSSENACQVQAEDLSLEDIFLELCND